MSDKIMQTVDLLISHSQILLRSRDYDEKLSQWGKGNAFLKALFYIRIMLYSIHYQRTHLEQTSISK